MAGLAARAWATATGVDPDAESRAALERKFLHELHENAAGVLAAESFGVLRGWGAQVPRSNLISDLWVDPAFRRQGVGARLLDALMAQILLCGFGEALVGTHADNAPAIALYEKAGFRIDRREMEWSESLARRVEKVHMRVRL